MSVLSRSCSQPLLPIVLRCFLTTLCLPYVQVRKWIAQMKDEGKAYYRGNTYLLAGVRLQKQVRTDGCAGLPGNGYATLNDRRELSSVMSLHLLRRQQR